MIRYLPFAIAAALFAQHATAAPASPKRSDNWLGWSCSADQVFTRVSFASMPPGERKAYTDAINCIHSQASNLDNAQSPAAVNKYQDYAVVHTERTGKVHLSGLFLTWHRHFLSLFEKDLRDTCGYQGRFPYWDFSATVDNLETSVEFNGDEYSMSSNGAPNGTDPIALGPSLVIPHGSGGGCIQSGPFADWQATLGYIDPLFLISGQALPPTAYDYNASCLIRDLNSYVAQTYTDYAHVETAAHSANASELEYNLNGVIGGSLLGVHSAGHFTVGGFMSSIHVSVQDPIWWMLHTNIDRIYSSYQINNPDKASDVYGTETANNTPPSANVTLDTIEPDWGYFDSSSRSVRDLISTTAGPFCYIYDQYLS